MPCFKDDEVQAIIDGRWAWTQTTVQLAQDLQLARMEIKRYEDLLITINNLIPRDHDDWAHQITSHTSTLPIVYQSLAESVDRLQEIVNDGIYRMMKIDFGSNQAAQEEISSERETKRP